MIKNILFFNTLLVMCLFIGTPKPSFGKQDHNFIVDRTKIPPTSANPAQSVGYYSKGCVLGAQMVKNYGSGFQLANKPRGRNWGHPSFVSEFYKTMKEIGSKHKTHFYTGDFSLSRGGPTRTGHSSHQSGLDVDIFFETTDSPSDQKANKKKWYVSYLKNGKVDLTRWSKAHDDLVVSFVKNQTIDRIFIHKEFKKHFCENRAKLNLADEELKKIRPWYGHDDHIHVRGKCPDSSSGCIAQKPIEDTDTCGSDLAWWYSDDAKYETSDYAKNVEDIRTAYLNKLGSLPEACQTAISKKSLKKHKL